MRAPAGGRDAQSVEAAILNAAGDRLLTVTPTAHDAQIDCVLPLASLPPGTYILEIAALPGATPRSLFAFRIQN